MGRRTLAAPVTRAIRLRPEAVDDFWRAREYYEEASEGLGGELEQAIDGVLREIAAAPQRYPVVYRGARRALLKRFPYAVFFLADDAAVTVLAIFHQARDPSQWRGRVR